MLLGEHIASVHGLELSQHYTERNPVLVNARNSFGVLSMAFSICALQAGEDAPVPPDEDEPASQQANTVGICCFAGT